MSFAKIIPSYYQSFKDAGIAEYSAFDVASPVTVNIADMCVTGVLSSASKDREGEIIDIEGIDTSRHELNPIVLLEHGKNFHLPIGATRTRPPERQYTVVKAGDKLLMTAYFSQTLKEAEQVFSLFVEEILNGWSMGFRRIAGKRLAPDVENGHPTGIYTTRCELLEASVVALPCNADCLSSVVSRGTIDGKALAPSVKSFLMPFCLPRKAWANGIDKGMQHETKAASSVDQSAGGSLVANRRKTRVTNATRNEITRETVGAFQPAEGRTPRYEATEPYESALQKPLHQRLAAIRERDEDATLGDRPNRGFARSVLNGVVGFGGQGRAEQIEGPGNLYRQTLPKMPADMPQHDREMGALAHTIANAGEQHGRRINQIFRELHDTNQGSLSPHEFVQAHAEGHFRAPSTGEVEESRQREAAPEGWTKYPGGSDNGRRADESQEEDKSMQYKTGDLEEVGDDTREQMEAANAGSQRYERMPVDRSGRYSGQNYMSDSEMARLRSSGSHSEHPEEEAIEERDPRVDLDRLNDRREANAEAQAQRDVPTREVKDMDENGMTDMPGAAALRKLHGHFSALQSLCGSMKDIEQPKVRALLEKLSTHAAGHMEGIGELFGGIYGDHKPLVCKDADGEVREGAPANQDGYEAKGVEEDYQGEHPAPSAMSGRMPQERSQDYFNGPEKRRGGHRFGRERPLTETEMDIGSGGGSNPAGWESAPGGAREHGGRFPQRTESQRHPRGWQTAPSNEDDSLEIRDSRGNFRSAEELDAAWERSAGHPYDPKRAAELIRASRSKSYEQENEIERLKREIKRKAEILGVA